MMPINHILRECTAGYKLSKSQEKVNHLRYRDDIKLFVENEEYKKKTIQMVRIYSLDLRIEFGMEKCTMLVMKSRKRRMTEGIERPNQEKI